MFQREIRRFGRVSCSPDAAAFPPGLVVFADLNGCTRSCTQITGAFQPQRAVNSPTRWDSIQGSRLRHQRGWGPSKDLGRCSLSSGLPYITLTLFAAQMCITRECSRQTPGLSCSLGPPPPHILPGASPPSVIDPRLLSTPFIDRRPLQGLSPKCLSSRDPLSVFRYEIKR